MQKKNLRREKGILYLIADFAGGEEPVCAALSAGVDVVQLREKNLSSAEYLRRALKMRELAHGFHTLFVVNDRVDIALLSGADGVHLGQQDVPVEAARRLFPGNFICRAHPGHSCGGHYPGKLRPAVKVRSPWAGGFRRDFKGGGYFRRRGRLSGKA